MPHLANASRLEEYQRSILSFSRTASEDLPIERLAQHFCAQISFVTHIGKTKILKYRADHADLLVIAGVGWKPGVVGQASLPIDEASPAGRSIQTAAPVIIDDIRNSTEFRMSPLLQEHDVVCLANVPIMIDGQTWGVLEADASEPRQFRDEDMNFFMICANMFAGGVSRAQTRDRVIEAAQAQARAENLWRLSLRELQHRTKNNLQTIISFLSLHRRNAASEEEKNRFRQVMDQVQAISLAQDQLGMSPSASEVNFADYLRSLCANVSTARAEIALEVEADTAFVPLDKAVVAGLMVNELITNGYKYAFDPGEAGLIRVRFAYDCSTELARLGVEDNGKGMGRSREGGIGLKLVEGFADQLAGRVVRHKTPKGTHIEVCFPLAASKQSHP